MWYFAWRVAMGFHDSISVDFLLIGHTQFAPDGCLGIMKKSSMLSQHWIRWNLLWMCGKIVIWLFNNNKHSQIGFTNPCYCILTHWTTKHNMWAMLISWQLCQHVIGKNSSCHISGHCLAFKNTHYWRYIEKILFLLFIRTYSTCNLIVCGTCIYKSLKWSWTVINQRLWCWLFEPNVQLINMDPYLYFDQWSGWGMGERVLCSKVITAYPLIGWIFDLKVQYIIMNLLCFDPCSVVGGVFECVNVWHQGVYWLYYWWNNWQIKYTDNC